MATTSSGGVQGSSLLLIDADSPPNRILGKNRTLSLLPLSLSLSSLFFLFFSLQSIHTLTLSSPTSLSLLCTALFSLFSLLPPDYYHGLMRSMGTSPLRHCLSHGQQQI